MPPTLTLTLDEAPASLETWDLPGLIQEHQGMVYGIAFHSLRNRAQADDVAQEAFIRLARNLPGIQSREHLVRWLRQVTTRLCIDEIRRHRPSASLEEVGEPAVPPQHTDPLLAERLRQQVAALPDKARLAVILRFQEDLDPAEIADVLNESVHTVKSRLQRALATLRKGLEHLGGPHA